MNRFLEKVLIPEVWVILIIVNCLLFVSSSLISKFTPALLNAFSGVFCYFGYLRAKKRERAKKSDA